MPAFIKHVGKVGDRKVAVIFRQIPGEDHMALIVYTETLNQNIHDPLMAAIESAQAQSSSDLGEPLNRAYTIDGKIILQVLHGEGMMKKMQTNQIVMTPTPNSKSHIRLSELNALLNEMEKGEDAVRRLAELDASRGLQDPKDVARRVYESERNRQPVKPEPSDSLVSTPEGVIADNQLAVNLRNQAQRMAAEARGLLAESERLLAEASRHDPQSLENTSKKSTKTKKTINTTVATQVEAKKPGRPRRATVAG